MSVHFPTVPSATPRSQGPRPNFGALVSAIHRGDLAAASTAFAALSGSDGLPRGLAKGPLDALGAALNSGDAEAARAALKDFQAKRGLAPDQPVPAHSPAPAPSSSSTIEILV